MSNGEIHLLVILGICANGDGQNAAYRFIGIVVEESSVVGMENIGYQVDARLEVGHRWTVD